MIHVLTGHRGVGKTSLLKRVERYLEGSESVFYDLDEEIEKKEGRSVSEIFTALGEEGFRAIEQQTLKELTDSFKARERKKKVKHMWLSVGAGFKGDLSFVDEVIWVRRTTDEMGRIFFDRPRLDASQSQLQEFLARKPERDEKYRRDATVHLFVKEGISDFDEEEKSFFCRDSSRSVSGVFTLTPYWLIERRWKSLGDLPWQKVELRDDLLSEKEISEVIDTIGEKRTLLSYRRRSNAIEGMSTQKANFKGATDWALELGPPTTGHTILSVHELEEGESLCELLRRLEGFSEKCEVLKAAPEVKTFSELKLGYDWQQRDSKKRAFLPRSATGRWSWFRHLMKGRMPLGFWRLDEGVAADQPLLTDWMTPVFEGNGFAAILGAPVDHSWTPKEHQAFFNARGLPVLRISIERHEWGEAIPVLQELGMRAAAVTSPHKKEAFHLCDQLSDVATQMSSVNTLFFDKKSGIWTGENTDFAGFKKLIEGVGEDQKVAIWGGGGTLGMIRSLMPEACEYSARTGQLREESESVREKPREKPEVLVWAAGSPSSQPGDSSYEEACIWPPDEWPLQMVIDLSYSEDSPAREIAAQRKCVYISGEKMFKHQAKLQRSFWGEKSFV